MFHIFIFKIKIANTFNRFSDEAMDVDEDESDSETTRAAEGVLERLDSAATQRQQPNNTDNSYLDSVNFSWLKDYFK